MRGGLMQSCSGTRLDSSDENHVTTATGALYLTAFDVQQCSTQALLHNLELFRSISSKKLKQRKMKVYLTVMFAGG